MLYLLSRYFEFGYLGVLIHDRTLPTGVRKVPIYISKCILMGTEINLPWEIHWHVLR